METRDGANRRRPKKPGGGREKEKNPNNGNPVFSKEGNLATVLAGNERETESSARGVQTNDLFHRRRPPSSRKDLQAGKRASK